MTSRHSGTSRHDRIAALACPPQRFAQEAVLSGTVTDSTGAVLPGVTVTAVHEATATGSSAVTDERGDLSHCRCASASTRSPRSSRASRRSRGRACSCSSARRRPSTCRWRRRPCSETVTVTAEAPLLRPQTSSLGGNIDPRQVQELPVNGRNWMALALLAPGSRTQSRRNAHHAAAGQKRRRGARVPAQYRRPAGVGRHRHRRPAEVQPGFDRRVPVHLEPVRRDDGPIDRRAGERDHQVGQQPGRRACSAATSATASSTRRIRCSDVVEPIDNQQFSTASAARSCKDKLHYFGNYEYEREPRTSICNTPYPAFNVDLTGMNNQKKGGVRLDYQLSHADAADGQGVSRAALRAVRRRQHRAIRRPPAPTREYNDECLGQLTQVLSNRALNEIKVG